MTLFEKVKDKLKKDWKEAKPMYAKIGKKMSND